MKEKINKIDLYNFHSSYDKEIRELKEKILFDIREYFIKTYELELIAEWVDFRTTDVFNDVFLYIKNNIFYNIRIQSSANIIINGISFRRFDTINLGNVPLQIRGSIYGYEINENNICINTNNKTLHPTIYTYRDYLRKNKIDKLLKKNV